MGQYTSYYLYQKYEQREGQDPIPCTPNVYSVDGYGTMQKVIKIENDPDCGYEPPTPTEPIYRWYQMPISEGYVCDECPELQYRWVESGTTCVGFDKWNRSIEQYSEDGGTTWHNTNPPVYSATSLIEVDSEDCGYVPPAPTGNTKFSAIYSNGQTYSLECNSYSSLMTGETKPSGYEYSAMTSAIIGDCVDSIDNYTFVGCKSLTSVTLGNNVTTIAGAAFPNTPLQNVVFNQSLEIIGNGAFSGCSGMTMDVVLPSIQYIYQNSFADTNINSIELGSSVISIAGGAKKTFGNSLTQAIIHATEPPRFSSLSYTDIMPFEGSYPIYVPSESVDTYKNNSYWSRYASRIQAIP